MMMNQQVAGSFIPTNPSAGHTGWSNEENKLFEVLLARYYADPLKFIKIAQEMRSKSPTEVETRFRALQEDIHKVELGVYQLPEYGASDSDEPAVKKQRENKKGVAWTAEEHRLFLLGLQKFGKGDWRSISRHFVQSRTPTQVASHAQKYFIRMNSLNKKEKRRSSIHDIAPAPCTSQMPQAPILPFPLPHNMIKPEQLLQSMPQPPMMAPTAPQQVYAPPTLCTS